MGSVTIFTYERMAEIESQAVVGGAVVGDDLVLERHDATTFIAGDVRGPTGATGASGGQANGSFTPTLTGMVIGTTGTPVNAAVYVFSGGPNVGDKGILNVSGRLVFGNTGQTFPTSPTLTLPAGFNINNTVPTSRPIGLIRMVDVSAGVVALGAVAVGGSAGVVAFYAHNVAGTYLTEAGITTTAPWTWAQADRFEYDYTVAAVRV